MFQLLELFPFVGVVVLVLGGIFTMLISSKVYLFFNRQLLSVNKKHNSRSLNIFKVFLKKKVDLLNNDESLKFYKWIKIKMLRSGFYNMFAPLIYMLFAYFMPIMVFLILIFNTTLLSAFVFSISIFASVEVILYAEKKEVEMEWNKRGYRIYRYIYNQLSAGVNIHDTLKSLYIICIGSRLEVPMYNFSAWYGRTLDIDVALAMFKRYFTLPDIHIFCTTLELGVKRGDISSLVDRQVESMFKKYFNYVQNATQKCNIKTAAIAIMLGSIICTMIIIPMLRDLGSAVNSLFSS